MNVYELLPYALWISFGLFLVFLANAGVWELHQWWISRQRDDEGRSHLCDYCWGVEVNDCPRNTSSHIVASLYCAQIGCEEHAVKAVSFGGLSIGLCEDHYRLVPDGGGFWSEWDNPWDAVYDGEAGRYDPPLADGEHEGIPVTESDGGDR